MPRYDRQTKPGLVALYDIRPGNGAGPFLQPRSPHGALKAWKRELSIPLRSLVEHGWLYLTGTPPGAKPTVSKHSAAVQKHKRNEEHSLITNNDKQTYVKW